uniref:type II secretion system protein n=1 Tax=Candidatus Scatousia sp. TaxID=3085663 RepID=UPI00402A565C
MSTGGGGNLKTKTFRKLPIRKKGFTLAEVLITLGIIGIVAAMTLPTLVNKYQKRTYIAGLQKFYTQISQAMQTMKQQTNCEDM